MKTNSSRRDFFRKSAGVMAGIGAASLMAEDTGGAVLFREAAGGPRVGLVTYLLAQNWDVDTIIKNCTETKFEGVELRTTHAHGVEVTLSRSERLEVKKKFEDSPVELASLGSAFEYHSADQGEVRKNIDGTKEYVKLAHDVGAKGVKVRPNGLQVEKGIPVEQTLEQIGRAVRECAAFAGDYGVEIRMEVHGRETSRVPYIRKIIDYADHSNFYVCWNSNPTDLEDGGLEANFELVQEKISFVHMRDLYLEDYPWRQLFGLLNAAGYSGFCCAEIPPSEDPLRVMKYYRALFLAYQNRI